MPQKRDPKKNPKALLGKRLRAGRIAAGFTSQDALAAKLGFDRSVVAKAETGDRPPTDAVLVAWVEACGLDPELFADLTELARSSDGPIPQWFEDWLEAEAEATELLIWSPILIPGLLQTEDYAKAVFLRAQPDTSDEVIDALVSVRIGRQVILDRAEPPEVVVLLDEAVLHRLIGSPETMADALNHVVAMSRRPNIVIQVLPLSLAGNAGLSGAFDIARSDGAPDILRIEGVEDQTAEKRSLVRTARVAFNRLRADALNRDESRELILKAARKWME